MGNIILALIYTDYVRHLNISYHDCIKTAYGFTLRVFSLQLIT